jgi:hypothetical protein
MFAIRCEPYKTGLAEYWLIIAQSALLFDELSWGTLIFHSFEGFSTAKAKLPPISVGASVDNVFAIRYRSCKPWLTKM